MLQDNRIKAFRLIRKIIFRKICLIVTCTLFFYYSYSQTNSDSISNHGQPQKTQKYKGFIAPTLLIGYGVATIGYNRVIISSRDVYNRLQKNYPYFQTHVDDYLRYVPLGAVYGLNLVGLKGQNKFIDRTIIYLISSQSAKLTYRFIKRKTEIYRPDSSDHFSLPSGHTTIAFVGATFLFHEYKDVSPWIGVAGYTAAAATGALRMLNNKHWMSDVMVGAGLGILTTELTYLAYPWFKKIVTSKIFKKHADNVFLMPYYYENQIGFTLNINLDKF